MSAPGIHERARRSVKRFVRKWEAVQVELHGFYSTERFRAMTEYCRSASFCRAVLMLLLTPLPSLILVALIDAMPLQDTELGIAYGTINWVRGTLTTFIYTHCAIEQIRLYSPSLELTLLAGLCISIPTAILTNALGLLLSVYVCWPIPFATVVLSGPWLGFTTFFLLRVRGAHMRTHPEAVKDVVQFATMAGTQVSIGLLYAVFNTIFTNISRTAIERDSTNSPHFLNSVGGYLTILYYLPNRRFYPQFADVTDNQVRRMVSSVLGYGLLELGSLILLVGVLNHFVHRHSLQQLAFVMEQEFFLVQPKLILWVTMTIQASLPQLGKHSTQNC
jgi:hypothetical protein